MPSDERVKIELAIKMKPFQFFNVVIRLDRAKHVMGQEDSGHHFVDLIAITPVIDQIAADVFKSGDLDVGFFEDFAACGRLQTDIAWGYEAANQTVALLTRLFGKQYFQIPVLCFASHCDIDGGKNLRISVICGVYDARPPVSAAAH